ncbi:MAG: lysozyme inhibitor LprI family protein [Paeniclostridium sordellii]|nr:lysozyme inhibitor LprI family protein [Paeniclostridium sordellii]
MVKFKFMETEVSISEERDNYNKIRLQYKTIAERCREEFIQEYTANNKNLDDVINKGYDQGAYFILQVIRNTVDKLVENKFYTINTELFVEKYCQEVIESWENAYSKINDKYMDIVLDEKQKEEYRQYRKNSRGRWQGGGFGVQGAVKGAVKAGAMNAVTGMAHGTFNMIGRIGSSIKANNQKLKVFNDSSTLETLANGVYSAVFYIHYAHTKFLEDNTDLEFGYVSSEESKQGRVVFSNIKGRNIDSKEKIEIIKTLIDLNPYMLQIYTYAVDSFGDENREIFKIANYFGYNIDNYKYHIIKNKITTLATNTEEETIKAKNIALQEMKRLGIDSDINEIKELDEKLNQFDIEARTVNGILFKNREEATLAKEEKVKIESILNKANMDIEEEVVNSKNKIIELRLNTIIVNSYMEVIDKKIEEFDLQARTVEDVLFNTREEANKARADKLKIEKMINSTDKTDENSLLSTKVEILKFKSKLESTKRIVNEIEEVLNQIDLKERTVEGILFETREEAKLARIEKIKLDKIMYNIDLDNEDNLKQIKTQIQSENFETTLGEKTIQELDKKLKWIDEKERTVEGILFETREEANLAKDDNFKLKQILIDIDTKNENSLEKAKKQIESGSFKPELVEIYLDRIKSSIESIRSQKLAKNIEHKKNKESFKSMLLCAVVIISLGMYFFGKVGIIMKIIIGIFLLGSVVAVFEEYKKMRVSGKVINKSSKMKGIIGAILLITVGGILFEDKNNSYSQIEPQNELNYEQYENYQEKENKEDVEGVLEDESINESSRQSLKEEYIQKLNMIEDEVSTLSYDGSTMDMKETSSIVLKKWDDILNEIYGVLKTQLSSSEMEILREQQREWIAIRDAEAEELASEFEGGSMYDLEYTEALSRQTKERCYELVEKYMK